MRNTISYFAVIMLFSLSASAITPSIYIFSPGLRIGDSFNLGHTLSVGGYIGSGENIDVRVEFYIDPGANQIKITEFEHSFSTGESLLLSEYEDDLTFQIEELQPGTHYVKMFIYDTSLPDTSPPIEDTQSVFYVTDELDLSSCNVDKEIVLVGEDVYVSCPYVLSSFGQTSSYANITLRGETQEVSAPSGSFSHPIKFTGGPQNNVFIKVWDEFGNKANKTIDFMGSNLIIIKANAGGFFIPGREVPLLVSLENIRGDPVVGDINASMIIDSTVIDLSESGVSSTTFRFLVPEGTPPGSYYVKLDASDSYQNRANTLFYNFNVTRVAKKFESYISKTNFEVGDIVGFGITIYDQQNETIPGKLIAADFSTGTEIFESLNLTTDPEGYASGSLEVTPSMPAGNWQLRFRIDDSIISEEFNIGTFYDLSLILDTPNKSGDKITFPLAIWNNGNINVDSELFSSCQECLGMRSKTVSITKGHVRYENITWYYSLSQPPGEYNISFCMNLSSQLFCSNNQTIEIGQTMSEDTGFFFLEIAAAFVGILVLIYFVYYMMQTRSSHL